MMKRAFTTTLLLALALPCFAYGQQTAGEQLDAQLAEIRADAEQAAQQAEQQIEAQAATIDALRERLDAAQQQVEALQGERAELEAAISEVRHRVETLEAPNPPPDPEPTPTPKPDPDARESLPPSTYQIGQNTGAVKAWAAVWPFANAQRSAKWTHAAEEQIEAGNVTPGGWPLFDGRQVGAVMLYDHGQLPPGRYVAEWEGTGRLDWTHISAVSEVEPLGEHSAALTVPPRDQRAEKARDWGVRWTIRESDPDDPIRDVRVWMPGTEAGDLIHPTYLDRIRPFPVIRFMDWQRTNNSSAVDWADRAKLSDPLWSTGRGVPIEAMIDLCNEVDADPWFCIPHRASDQYVREFAELVRGRLEPGRRVYVEYSNEVWNWTFDQTHWATERGLELTGGDDGNEARWAWYTKRSRAVWSIFRDVLGADRVVAVLGTQSSNAWATGRMIDLNPDAAQEADALAIAPYFGVGDPVQQLTPDATVDQIIEACRADMGRVREQVGAQAAIAEQHGLALIGYEGGQGLAPNVVLKGDDPEDRQAAIRTLTETLTQTQLDPRMGGLYGEFFGIWRQAEGGVFVHYQFAGHWGRSGFWGSLQRLNSELQDQYKYRALEHAQQSAYRGEEGQQ